MERPDPPYTACNFWLTQYAQLVAPERETTGASGVSSPADLVARSATSCGKNIKVTAHATAMQLSRDAS